MAKKTGKKRYGGQSARRSLTAKTSKVEISIHPLFDQAEETKKLASIVLATLSGTAKERKALTKFVSEMDNVKLAIKSACESLDTSNPMYREFTIST